MTHGDHWAAIDRDKEKIIGEMLSIVAERGDIVGRVNTVVGDGEKEWMSEVVGLRYPSGPLGFLCLIVSANGMRMIWDAFPHAEGSRRSTLVVEGIEPEANGIEAVIHVSVPGAGGFSFSDPLYFLEKNKLKVGEQAVFRLSAIAYGLRKGKSMMSLTEGPLFELLRAGCLEDHPEMDPAEVTSVPISMLGTACMFPGEDADAQVMFRIDDLEYLDCGRPMTRLSGVVMRSDDQEIGVDVYASISALDGYVPSVGDDVGAEVWMQGVLDE